MEDFYSFKLQMAKRFLFLYLLLVAVLLFMGNWAGAYGLTFGTIMALLNFFLLASTLEKSMHMEPQKARFYVTFQYFIRYGVFFLVIIIAMMRADMHYAWAVAGLLIPKAVILVGNLYSFRKQHDIKQVEEK